MPPSFSKPSPAASSALIYITIGALMSVWSGIWFAYLRNTESHNQALNYLCFGFLVTGVVLLGIGLTLGPIARWSRKAELPPTDDTSNAFQATRTS